LIRNRTLWLFFGILAIIIVSSIVLMRVTTPPPASKPRINTAETADGNFYSIMDGHGQLILRTGFPVNIGDIFIDEKDRAFKVARLDGWKATAEPTSIPETRKDQQQAAGLQLDNTSIPVQGNGGIHVGMYHTHSDESYPISDGTSSIRGKGTIYEVGKSLTGSLITSGISVSHSDATHGPHDPNAYYRSRRTVFQLLKERPDAVFDVHRDSAPSEEYLTLINGLPTSRTMIVVGRQNPNMGSNLDFARYVKKQADELYPGLMRGIFIGRGSYNQDLYPNALLFEIGTDQLSRESAERGARNLGDVVAQVLRENRR
jgi:stage II sporulation protein P